ncbi:hypothetical protein HT765_004527 [Salmonella enterica]|nr:hypothetical protein [Salmonella enterica]
MCEKEPQLKIAQQLALDFYRILKTKNKQQLSRWFSNVSESARLSLSVLLPGWKLMQQQYVKPLPADGVTE